jgi:hypothetical protein
MDIKLTILFLFISAMISANSPKRIGTFLNRCIRRIPDLQFFYFFRCAFHIP